MADFMFKSAASNVMRGQLREPMLNHARMIDVLKKDCKYNNGLLPRKRKHFSFTPVIDFFSP